jgi:hypothetical protein
MNSTVLTTLPEYCSVVRLNVTTTITVPNVPTVLVTVYRYGGFESNADFWVRIVRVRGDALVNVFVTRVLYSD